MQQQTLLLFTLLTLSITGCDNDSDSDNRQSPLSGTWTTVSCEQASDNEQTPVNIWYKGLYEFTLYGTIRLGSRQYSDSNCSIITDTTLPDEMEIPITYQNQGPRLLEEGIDGGGLLIEMGAGEQITSVEAFYTINDGTLCFSDAFTFEALMFGISEAGSTAIDFDHCLN